jgi:hypothetical protein
MLSSVSTRTKNSVGGNCPDSGVKNGLVSLRPIFAEEGNFLCSKRNSVSLQITLAVSVRCPIRRTIGRDPSGFSDHFVDGHLESRRPPGGRPSFRRKRPRCPPGTFLFVSSSDFFRMIGLVERACRCLEITGRGHNDLSPAKKGFCANTTVEEQLYMTL